MRHIPLLTLLLSFTAVAQVPLPYATGFDNAAQQSGWQQFRTGHLSNYDWSFSAFGSPSAPNHLWHDYPVGGSATDTVRDWWVSPLLDLSAASTLTAKVNVYAITGNSMPSDSLCIMLLVGSPNPALATITPLADLLPLVTSGSTFTQLPSVYVPAVGPAYIAFYYQATQNWLTPGIDDVSITAAGVGVPEVQEAMASVSLGPNPCTDQFSVSMLSDRWKDQLLWLEFRDARGGLILRRSFTASIQVDVNWPDGCYAYTITDEGSSVLARGRSIVAK